MQNIWKVVYATQQEEIHPTASVHSEIMPEGLLLLTAAVTLTKFNQEEKLKKIMVIIWMKSIQLLHSAEWGLAGLTIAERPG